MTLWKWPDRKISIEVRSWPWIPFWHNLCNILTSSWETTYSSTCKQWQYIFFLESMILLGSIRRPQLEWLLHRQLMHAQMTQHGEKTEWVPISNVKLLIGDPMEIAAYQMVMFLSSPGCNKLQNHVFPVFAFWTLKLGGGNYTFVSKTLKILFISPPPPLYDFSTKISNTFCKKHKFGNIYYENHSHESLWKIALFDFIAYLYKKIIPTHIKWKLTHFQPLHFLLPPLIF